MLRARRTRWGEGNPCTFYLAFEASELGVRKAPPLGLGLDLGLELVDESDGIVGRI